MDGMGAPCEVGSEGNRRQNTGPTNRNHIRGDHILEEGMEEVGLEEKGKRLRKPKKNKTNQIIIVAVSFVFAVFLPHPSYAVTCAGSCGGAADGCWCDEACVQYSDCCPDACIECGVCNPGSCIGSCGLKSGSCWCDNLCHKYGDCCTDICEACSVSGCELKGAVCEYGDLYCNPYVRNVAASVFNLRSHGDLMGFNMGDYPDVNQNFFYSEHWQGTQRLMTGDGRYLAVSANHKDWSRFAIVHLGTRSTGSDRWRSNRLVKGVSSWNVGPSSWDVVVKEFRVSSVLNHAGGLHVIGNYIAVPLEEKDGSSNYGMVVLYDISIPENPRFRWAFSLPTIHAGAVAISKLNDGRFLMVTAREDSEILDIFLSSANSLTAPSWTHLATWRKSEWQGDGGIDTNWGAYQAIALVTEHDGDLYLIGTHNTGDLVSEKDWIDAYRLILKEDSTVKLSKVAKRHLFCGTPGKKQCNLDAGAGVYVTSDHRLYLYATEHDNDGPGDSVKMMEFRPDPHRSTCTNMYDSFVELYEHSNFSGRSAMLDYRDRSLRDIDNFRRLEDLTDKISSVRWCLPIGHSFILYRHDHQRGGFFVLRGNGTVQTDSTLHNDKFSDGSRVGDEASSGRWN